MSNNAPDYNDNLVFAPTCANNAQVQLVPPVSDIKKLKDEIATLKSLYQSLESSDKEALKNKDTEIAKLKEQLAEHEYYCCCQENEVLYLKIDKLEKQLEIAKDTLNAIYETRDSNAKIIKNCFIQIEELEKWR